MEKKLTQEMPHFDKVTMFAVLSGLWFFGGIYGFVYETIFYFFNSGMTQIYWRGGGFGPWLQIYGFGSLLIYFACYRFRKNPFIVMAVSGLGCGILELAAGYIFYGLCGITRGWDYNKEILNFGNIGGYVCLRSVLVFALSGLLLVYVIVPVLFKLLEKMNRTAFLTVSFTLGGLFLADFIYNDVVSAIFPSLIYAVPLYSSLGVPYLTF